MGRCGFCEQNERETFWSRYCEECALLRRLLVVYGSKKAVEILKKTCLRNDTQIECKIKEELKPKKVNFVLPLPVISEEDSGGHSTPVDPPPSKTWERLKNDKVKKVR